VLYIANIRREYFKLSLENEIIKVKIDSDKNFVGHRKAFKGVTAGIQQSA
jgi:hypothetical protein